MNSKTIISREEYQVKKLMEGLNKSKTAPAENEKEDKEVNKEANQHMPKYIAQAPWYLNQKEEGLAHQRAQGGKSTLGFNEWYQRGVKQPAAYKYRKGACENCGAITHKTKDCCERPRKLGAKWTGKDIQGDEIIQNFDMDYAAKRDRWSGYDPEMYNDVIQEYEQFEEARKQMRHNELEKANQPDEDAHIDDEYKERIFDNSGSVTTQDPKIKTHIKNLRIREDIAKYLMNLDENSAYYDAKTHSMRENPVPDQGTDEQAFKGDNFSRLTGDTVKLLEQEKFVWDLVKKEGAELNSVAMPTATEMIVRKAKEKLTQQAEERKRQLAEKYGEKKEGDPDYDVIFGQSETYVEYLPDGKIKNARNVKSQAGKSRYEEDIFPNDHTTVWGSWWNPELGWGFACCHQTERSGMCLGEKGKKLALVKEFKIKKAKQEELNAFTKQVVGQDASPDHAPEEETALEEKATVDQKEAPLQQVQPPPKEEKPAVSHEANIQRAPLAKEEEKKSEKKETDTSKLNKPKKKVEQSSESSDSSATSSSGESSDSSDSSSDSESKSSPSSSRSPPRKRGNRLKEKQDRRQREKNRKHGIAEEKKLHKAVRKEEGKVRDAHKSLNEKRKYNSVKGDNNDVTAEEIEAYKLTKKRFDDPMHFA